MGARRGRVRAGWIIVAAAVVALPVGGIAAARTADNRPSLRSEVAHLVPLADATARQAVPGRAWVLSPLNADLFPATLTDPHLAPGFDRCDYWWNLVRPVRQTDYGYQPAVPAANRRSGADSATR